MILAFCRGKGFIAALIRWQTWSKYAHVALVTKDGVFEARPKGGVVRRKFWEDTAGIDFFVVTTEDDSIRTIHSAVVTDYLKDRVGCKYDWIGCLRFLTRRKKSNDRFFCSELVYAALRADGIELLRIDAPSKVSPGLLSYSPRLKQISTEEVIRWCAAWRITL
jgi:uncharacterized protein YycO